MEAYILVYVDDVLIASDSEARIEEVVKRLSENFGIRDLGPIKRFLGMNVKYDPVIRTVKIDQMKMITRIATEFGVVNSE